MYFWLFKIRILNRRRRGYQLKTPAVIVRRQNWAPFLHFITLKQMNQKIKAPGQHIKIDKLRLEGLNCKKPLELRGTRWRILILLLYWRGSPHRWHLQRGAHPKSLGFLLLQETSQDLPCLKIQTRNTASALGWKQDDHWLPKAALRARASAKLGKLRNRHWKWQQWQKGWEEALWVKAKDN